MTAPYAAACDAVLHKAVAAGVPGVVAMVTDRAGTTYEGVAGHRAAGGDQPMTPDTVFAIFSTTKAITGTTALQLVEEGKLDLDAPAKGYAPALGDIAVLDGFDDDGSPRTRPPASDVTTRQLLTHTAGFAYDFFNQTYNRLAQEQGQPSVITSSTASITTPLLFDPGTQWEYGSNLDWAGQVVEGITGKRLGEVMQERVFEPLGMTSTAFSPSEDMRARTATIHQHEGDSYATTDIELPADPEVHMGGHGLYGTVPDYLKFIRMWLNDGAADDGTAVLKPETVEMAVQNQLPKGMTIKSLPGVIATLSNEAEFFPGMPKTWALTFMINDEEAPTGRPAGQLAWAGLANTYFWIDRSTGVGGYWATNIFPFADPPSVGGFLELEKAVYDG
ncbi:MAG: serine hydrolase domain-containing protein [Nocardioides sp.]